MKNCKIALGIVSTIALGVIVYAITTERKNRIEKKLLTVADAGYETAFDILYPLKTKRYRRNR